MRRRITLPSVLMCVLAACGDSSSPVGPVATAPASFSRGVTGTPQLLVSLPSAQGSTVGPGGAQDGKVVTFGPKSSTVTEVASGAPLLVDVEFGRGRTLFALSQGDWAGTFAGDPALPNTGALVRVDANGAFTIVADGLDRPTSMEIIGNTAYVVTLTGQIWTIDNIASPPYGA